MERENLELAEWLQKNHKATQEKINLLTEATFAITNTLAGVQALPRPLALPSPSLRSPAPRLPRASLPTPALGPRPPPPHALTEAARARRASTR